jgi:hypothetical protein
MRGERGGTTQQNTIPTSRTIPGRFDAGNKSGNTPLNSSGPYTAAGVSPVNPELTTAISSNIGPDASKLIIRRGDSIVVYLQNSKGLAVGFNSTIGLGGEFPAYLVQRVEPQPNPEPIIAIAIGSQWSYDHHTPYHATSTHRSSHSRASYRELSSPEISDRETSPLHRALDSVVPGLDYSAQDCIIVCSQKRCYGLNVRTELMGRFKKEDVCIVNPREESNSDGRKASAKTREQREQDARRPPVFPYGARRATGARKDFCYDPESLF